MQERDTETEWSEPFGYVTEDDAPSGHLRGWTDREARIDRAYQEGLDEIDRRHRERMKEIDREYFRSVVPAIAFGWLLQIVGFVVAAGAARAYDGHPALVYTAFATLAGSSLLMAALTVQVGRKWVDRTR